MDFKDWSMGELFSNDDNYLVQLFNYYSQTKKNP